MKKVLLVLAYVLVCIGLAFADDANDGGRYLVLSTARTKTLRAELDSALAQGYALIAGDPSGKILVLQKRAASEPHKYQVSDNIYQTIKKNEYKGYRVLPWSFSDSHGSWAAMLESLNEGEPQPEYKLATTAYTRNLQKDISEASAGGYRAVAMAGLQGQGALLVKMPGATTASASYELLATKKISTMEKEIAASAAKGFKVIAATGAGNEILVLMESLPEGESKREYKVISTMRTSKFEQEINEAAAEGYRIVPQTGAALKKGGILTGGTYGYEQAIIMEKRPDASSIRYMFLGAQRESTVQRELNATPPQCTITTMFLTYQELATVLGCVGAK